MKKANVRVGGKFSLLSNGFTLIELLAVLLIIAALALIAIPKVADIITNSEESTILVSGKNYLKAVEAAILSENTNKNLDPKLCTIESDGNLTCDGISLLVDVKGNRPTSGDIVIENRKPIEVIDMIIGDYVLEMNKNEELIIFGKSEDITPQGTYLMVSGNIREDAVFLGGTIKKNEVESITIKNRKNVPSDAIGSWDVSALKDSSVMAWYTDKDSNGLYELYIGGDGGVKANPNSKYLFSNFINVEQVDVTYLNTSDVTNMNSMFDMKTNTSSSIELTSESKLTSIIGLEKFNTSNVTTMNRMFIACSNLQDLNISSFNTSKVTDMASMFSGCIKLTTLDVSNFDTSKVTNMSQIFAGFKGTSLDVNNFDTSNVTNMGSVFVNCSNLKNLNVSKFNTSQVTNMSSMFQGCSGLTSLDVGNFDTNQVTAMSFMFYECSKLTIIDVSNFDTSQVTTMSYMFYRCGGLTSLDVSNFDTNQVTAMSFMFSGCIKLTNINMKNSTFTNVTSYTNMFSSTTVLTSITVKDSTSKTFIEARLADVSKTGVTVTISA